MVKNSFQLQKRLKNDTKNDFFQNLQMTSKMFLDIVGVITTPKLSIFKTFQIRLRNILITKLLRCKFNINSRALLKIRFIMSMSKISLYLIFIFKNCFAEPLRTTCKWSSAPPTECGPVPATGGWTRPSLRRRRWPTPSSASPWTTTRRPGPTSWSGTARWSPWSWWPWTARTGWRRWCGSAVCSMTGSGGSGRPGPVRQSVRGSVRQTFYQYLVRQR